MTKGCVACSSPIHNGSVTQPNTGILSPEAETSCNPDGDIVCLSENGATLLSWISEIDDPESSIISTLHSSIIPQIAAIQVVHSTCVIPLKSPGVII